jgi:hypothetical protein
MVLDTEHIRALLFEHYPGSKLVGEVTYADYNNGLLTITLNGKTWVYIMGDDGKIIVCERKTMEHDDSNMRGVLRDLKLNELTNE